jgi:hypothetical protein
VQFQFHDARRSLTKASPCVTPIRSIQSSGTEHEGRDLSDLAFAPISNTDRSRPSPR